MKYRKIIKLIRQKNRLAYLVFILMLAVVGMYAFYSMLYIQANNNKWRPLRRMGEGWYYYASDIMAEKSDAADEYIKKHFENLDVKHVNSFEGYDVFSCSERAWEMFDYPLEKGTDFSAVNANEVIVSKDMEYSHPVDSTIEIKIYNTSSFYGKPSPVKTIECEVVGIMKQDEIFFRQPVGSVTMSNRVETSMFWEGQYGEQIMHCFLNPRIEIQNPEWYVRSSGIFFHAAADQVSELQKLFPENGKTYPAADILKKANPAYWTESRDRVIKVLAMSLACVIYFVVWISVVLKKSKRDFAYLMYINSYRRYYNRYFCASFYCLPLAFLLSLAAYFLPHNEESFWELHYIMLLVVFGVQFVVCLSGAVLSRVVNRNYHKRVSEHLENCDMKKLFIDDLSVFDNLVLMLTARGFAGSWAGDYVKETLEERKLAYCQGRRADMLSDEERMQINEIKEDIMRS
ncbi:MAG: hypothetical protein NC293_08115 [Roseburia sp.]|nr:hypothetical protein [Roseburia sp.]